MSYNRYFDPAQVESDQKDLIISQLKADQFELRQCEQNLQDLNAQLNNLDHSLAILKEEKARSEKDFKQRNEANMKTISALKAEIDQLKSELSNQNIDLQEMKADNVALVEMSEHRDYELQRLKNELSNVFEKNKKLKEEKNSFDDQLQGLNEERGQMIGNINSLKNKLDTLIQKNREFEKILRDIENQKNKLEKQEDLLKGNCDQLNAEINNRNAQIKKKEAALNEINKDLIEMESEAQNLDKIIEQNKGEANQLQKNLQNEQKNGNELGNTLTILEKTIRDREEQLRDLGKDLEAAKRDNYELKEDNKEFNVDIDKYLLMINELTLINKELREEIERFNEGDEKARNILNRRDKMMEIITKTETQIKQSYSSILHIKSNVTKFKKTVTSVKN
jgi:chromosome segregation ATPase